MKKTALSLALAGVLALAGIVFPAISAGRTTKQLPSTTPSSAARRRLSTRVRAYHHSLHPSSGRTTYHRRRVYHHLSPWRVSSFGDPGARDDPAGDDPVIRQAALAAIGNLNGSVVVVDPGTGRILSMVNQKLALTGAFTPCSSLKPIAALAGLSEGVISPETRLPAEWRVRVFFRSARVNVEQALALSDNNFFFKLGQMLGFARVSRYFHEEFGLGERAGLDLVGESPGVFPSAPPRNGSVGRLTYYGEGVQMTPLQLAAIASAIANGGTLYYLQYPKTSQDVANFQPRIRRRLDGVLPYLADVRDGMAGTVLFGTGKLAFDPGEQIFGKTGTCSENGAHLGWFASFSEEQRPDYVVVVLLRGGPPMFGPHAAEVAGRVYRDLALREKISTQALNAQPTPGANLP